ncbi:probable salivary secreted peptide [Episyrphus balteatus]|uniref:probable salivary secreted peptide n=1 Tax=Episyrphus balteatus TaxID=286459 RepID=UPI0024865B0B|nr:probable salivary secreted peptide [Episyrphus balteatus]
MKYFFVLTFAVVAALCIAISNGASAQYGTRLIHDILLYTEYVIKDSSWWGSITKDVRYPPKGFFNNKIITSIVVTDQTGGKDTSTGYSSLSEGGPGSTMAVVHIKAPRNCAMNFTVEIYGSHH